jgi:HlyD family secretion protein
MSPKQDEPLRAIRRLNLIGFVTIAVMVGGFGSWAAVSEFSGAVVAPGTIVVDSHVKKVQHPSGGIVNEILVKEGDLVEEGQVVVRLDDTVARATLGAIQSQIEELTAREARLIAERDDAEEVRFVSAFAKREYISATSPFVDEAKLFESRRRGRAGQKSQLRERVAQSTEEIVGLTAQKNAKERETALIKQELGAVSELYGKNLVSIARFVALQRDMARIEGEHGQFIAEIARARGKIAETELQIMQLDRDFLTDVLKDLRDTQGKLAELRERRVAADDQLKRVVIRAPASGMVFQLAHHTLGGVIDKGEPIMQIVPQADALVVEAKVSPQDIDQIAVGAIASVRIIAGDQRTMPNANGTLTGVSADLVREQQSGTQTGQSYYLVRIALPEEEVRRFGKLTLVPGMQTEVFVQTYARTPLAYFIKPLREQIARTFRER